MTAAPELLSRLEVMALAAPAVLRAFREGRVSRLDLWRACRRGAARYAEAVRRGDVVREGVALARAGQCAACPACTREATALAGVETLWCGRPLQCGEAGVCVGEDGGRVCGCLVALSVKGEIVPAGKTWVASESSPRAWAAAERAGLDMARG